MNSKMKLMKYPLLASISAAFALVAVGCGQQGGQENPGVAASSSSSQAPDDARLGRFTPIKPDKAQALTFSYKVYEFAADDSWVSIVPMPPKGGYVVVGINVPGNYDVKLTNEQCGSAVNISPSMGEAFSLTAADSKHRIAASKGMQLKISMPDTAPNNYFCNVAVAAAD
jgi:hypothetical protein